MKNMIFSLLTVFSVIATSTASLATPLSATTDEICVEAATASIVQYLQSAEPGAKLAIVRDMKGTITGLKDENAIYDDLEFSNVFEDDPNTHIYEFRDGDYIVFATVSMFAPNGSLACAVTDVDSGQDDQDYED